MPDPYLVKPDRDFLHRVLDQRGEDLKMCMQCATCSVVCDLSGGRGAFPRKEMIWAQWGLKDRIMADPDIWICHQCNDCSTQCPRGARPGDVLKSLFTHDKFGKCTTNASRKVAHLAAFYGFVALFVVTIWAVSDLYVMPLVGIDAMYPFGLLHPMEILANIGCLALIFGCVKAIMDRLILVFDLLVCLPFLKFSHVLYRTAALIYAEHSGRNVARV